MNKDLPADKPTKSPTFADIAKAAGVCKATVSLALRNNPRIPELTRKKIKLMLCIDFGYLATYSPADEGVLTVALAKCIPIPIHCTMHAYQFSLPTSSSPSSPVHVHVQDEPRQGALSLTHERGEVEAVLGRAPALAHVAGEAQPSRPPPTPPCNIAVEACA